MAFFLIKNLTFPLFLYFHFPAYLLFNIAFCVILKKFIQSFALYFRSCQWIFSAYPRIKKLAIPIPPLPSENRAYKLVKFLFNNLKQKAMITIEQIKKYAEKKNVPVEENFPQSSIRTRIEFGNYEIGIRLSNGVWYWWFNYCLCAIDDNDTNLFFSQRYSQNNGKKSKSFRVGFKAETRILKALCEK